MKIRRFFYILQNSWQPFIIDNSVLVLSFDADDEKPYDLISRIISEALCKVGLCIYIVKNIVTVVIKHYACRHSPISRNLETNGSEFVETFEDMFPCCNG